MDQVSSFFYQFYNKLGQYGPEGIFLFTCIVLHKYPTYCFLYILGFVFNMILNVILKQGFQHPRPSENKVLFEYDQRHGHWIDYNRLGMPSGHAQTMWFTTLYVFFVLKNTNISLFCLSWTLLTCLQRISFHFHTAFQVLMGSFFGILFSYFLFCYTQKRIVTLSTIQS